jgi:hypothetical protein
MFILEIVKFHKVALPFSKAITKCKIFKTSFIVEFINCLCMRFLIRKNNQNFAKCKNNTFGKFDFHIETVLVSYKCILLCPYKI